MVSSKSQLARWRGFWRLGTDAVPAQPEPKLAAKRRLEFRIPISPTEGFYSQIRLFNFALRRLGAPYDQARLLVVVGDNCDINSVRRQNRWSERFNIAWERVPDDLFNEAGIWGTANWRLNIPAGDAEIICLADADTALLRDIDQLVADFPLDDPAVRGHMAHFPPPTTGGSAPPGGSPDFWPWLFKEFEIDWPATTYPYSMDQNDTLPKAPAYFNLGFVAINSAALPEFDRAITETERRTKALTNSQMRCQIAVTIIAYRAKMDIEVLSARYNSAHDIIHMNVHNVRTDDMHVLHYLREDEFDRSTFLLRDNIDQFLSRPLSNPANIALQKLARDYRNSLE
jgi:hypothetical protein